MHGYSDPGQAFFNRLDNHIKARAVQEQKPQIIMGLFIASYGERIPTNS
jgi:hypothetical protein